MAKRQTRRAISVKGLTYQRLKKHCEENKVSISGYVEGLITAKLDSLGVPEETVLEPRPRPSRRPKLEDYTGSHFTF